MMRGSRALWRDMLLLLCGYIALFVLLHAKIPAAEPGLLAIAMPGYLEAAQRANPLLRLNAPLETATMALLRAEVAGVLAAIFAGYIGILRRARRGRYQPARLAPVLAGTALFSLPLILLPYILSSDIYSYIIYGRIAAIYGANPALVAPSAYSGDPFFRFLIYWVDSPSVYGPLWTLASHGLTLLAVRAGDTIWAYVLGYKLLALSAHLGTAGLLWSLLGRWKPRQQFWGTLLYAWNPLVLIELAGSAHNDALMILLIALSLWLAQRRAWRRAVVALVCAALVKWIAVILLPLYALLLVRHRFGVRGRLACAAQVGALVLGTALPMYALYGQPAAALGTLRTVPASSNVANSLAELAVKQAPALLDRLGIRLAAPAYDAASSPDASLAAQKTTIATAVGWLSKAISLLAWLGALAAIWRRPTFERYIQGGFWVFLLTLLAVPFFQPWYVIWPLALAALLDWRPAGLLGLAFSASAEFIYVMWRVRSLFVFVPVIALLLYLLWRTWRTAARATPPTLPDAQVS